MEIKKLFYLAGLIENHSLTLDISRERFVDLLKIHVGHDGNSTSDLFSADYVHYKGAVGSTGFYLRRKRGLFHNTRHFCKVIGTFREENNQLMVDLEFKNFPPPVYAFIGLVVIFTATALVMVLGAVFSFNFSNITRAFSNLFAVLILSGIVGAIVRVFSAKTILEMRYELESNFHKYVKNKF